MEVGGMGKKTPKKSEASANNKEPSAEGTPCREKSRRHRLAKIELKEVQQIKALIKAAKKARDLEIGKLKRRLKIQQRAEEGGADRQEGNDSEGEREGEKVKRKARFDQASKESIEKQLQAAKRIRITAVANTAGKKAGFGVAKEENLRLDDSLAEGEEPEPSLTVLVTRLLKSKAVTEQLMESKRVVDVEKAAQERSERRRAKAAAKAARKQAKAEERARQRLPEPEKQLAPLGQKALRRSKATQELERGKEAKRMAQKKWMSLSHEREMKEDIDCSFYKSQQMQNLTPEKQAVVEKTRAEGKEKSFPKSIFRGDKNVKNSKKRVMAALSPTQPPAKRPKQGLGDGEGLHPSWAAKKQKSGMLSKIPKATGTKLVFED